MTATGANEQVWRDVVRSHSVGRAGTRGGIVPCALWRDVVSDAGMGPWLPQPVFVVVVSMLDQRQGGHLLVLEEIRHRELNRFGLAARGKDHRLVLEHVLIDVERRAQQ